MAAGFIVAPLLLALIILSVRAQGPSGVLSSSSTQTWKGRTSKPSTTSQAWRGDSPPPPWVTGRAGQGDGPPPWVKSQGLDGQIGQGAPGGGGENWHPDGPPTWAQAQTTLATPTPSSSSSSSITEINILTTRPTPSRSSADILNSHLQGQGGTPDSASAPTPPSRRNIVVIVSIVLPLTLVVIGFIIAVILFDRKYQRRRSFFPRREQAHLSAGGGGGGGGGDKAEPLNGLGIGIEFQNPFQPTRSDMRKQGAAGISDDFPPVPTNPQLSRPRQNPLPQGVILEADPFADPPDWHNAGFAEPFRKRSMRSSLAVEVATPSNPPIRQYIRRPSTPPSLTKIQQLLLANTQRSSPLSSFLHNITSTFPAAALPFTFTSTSTTTTSNGGTRPKFTNSGADIETLALLLLTVFLTFKIVSFLGRLVVAWVIAMVKMVFWVAVAVLGVWIYVVGVPGVIAALQKLAGAWLGAAGLGV
ncbi:MAG: hypothetical protein M1816_004622 [Peltula sp. TS41687]|nr:MAG: hypothetical protein M1816_004622 [Peltula sp. TS41687]